MNEKKLKRMSHIKQVMNEILLQKIKEINEAKKKENMKLDDSFTIKTKRSEK